MNALMPTFPGMLFARGARHISPRVAVVAETMGWCYVASGGVMPGYLIRRRSRLNKAGGRLI